MYENIFLFAARAGQITVLGEGPAEAMKGPPCPACLNRVSAFVTKLAVSLGVGFT